MKIKSTIILSFVLFSFFLTGCDTTDTTPTPDNKDTTQTVFEPTKDVIELGKEENEVKKDKETLPITEKRTPINSTDIPEEIREKGYIRHFDTVQNPSNTHAYEIYIDKEGQNSCTAGYLDSDAPIHCLLRIIDLHDNTVINEYESDEYARFHIAKQSFTQPQTWYDNNSLLIEWGMGDACFGTHTVHRLNIITDKLTLIIKDELACTPGLLFTLPEQKLLFHFLGQMNTEPKVEKLEIYKIPDSTKSVIDLYIEDPETYEKTLDTSKVGELINTLDGVRWAEYNHNQGIVVFSVTNDIAYSYDPDKNEFKPL